MKRPDGWYHARDATIVAILLTVVAIFLVILTGNWWWLGLIMGSGIAIIITPDLDHEWQTWTEGWVSRRFGMFVGKLFRLWWSPYEIIFSHRSFFTHGGFPPTGILVMALVATPIRILYTFLWLIPLAYYVEEVRVWLFNVPIEFWLMTYFGWGLGDFSHYLSDYVFTRRSKKWKREYR